MKVIIFMCCRCKNLVVVRYLISVGVAWPSVNSGGEEGVATTSVPVDEVELQ
jgi:hypothetical protein